MLDRLLHQSPDGPLFHKDDLEDIRRWTTSPDEEAACLGKAQARRDKFPGYVAGHRQREHLKYGPLPADNASIMEWVAPVLNHARAKWSGEIDSGRIRCQFRDWLPSYFDDNRYFWSSAPARWLEAAELVRIACGLPRFRATRRAGQ
jgi:hypothetical protein